ncbi:hypothetical protein CW751_03880 [Brumimicrobium salinarum]|uniref:Uncharacterized protein n=1 Tax=Brumimicrobium salinarum TaxID=2058658 RepID=A0A2I0R538_9FLAO|nr:hypothetical protein [Brumimicrobium salinarum]PKR81675.1 hypothetical protein CW751_03880 [Brumimicrobium salinarum]
MKNRYVIAFNRGIFRDKPLHNNNDEEISEEMYTPQAYAKLMDVVRKFPKHKINRDDLFTCGFIKN